MRARHWNRPRRTLSVAFIESDPVTAQERLDDARRFVDRVAGYLLDTEGIR